MSYRRIGRPVCRRLERLTRMDAILDAVQIKAASDTVREHSGAF